MARDNSVSVEEMRAIEENSAYLGVTRLLLMENAGREVAREVLRRKDLSNKEVVIVAYGGNKGGDGFVAARHLAALGASVSILLLLDPSSLKTDEARRNWKIVRNMQDSVRVSVATVPGQVAQFLKSTGTPNVIIDAMLGTGLKGKLREPLKGAVAHINRLKGQSYIVAVDVPTGVDPDTGEVQGEAIRADLTVTHHRYKPGLLAKNSKKYTGTLVLADIGIPREAELFSGPGDVRRVIKRRSEYAHKGDSGRLLVIAGSKRYSGSAGLCGLAALRTGVDLVTVMTPAVIAGALQAYSPDLIVRSAPGDYFGRSSLKMLVELLQQSDAVALGPGLALESETVDFVGGCVEACKKRGVPMVIDADAIKALRGRHDSFSSMKVVLTPHAGEFKILTGVQVPAEVEDGWKGRIAIVQNWASKLSVTILLKGHYDIVSNGERTKVNRTGNPGMTVGGTGDVLTGIAGAFLAWGNESFEAAAAAAFLNGSVGDYVSTFKGYHLLASDLVSALPTMMARYDDVGKS